MAGAKKAKKKSATKKKAAVRKTAETVARFPYTTKPASLRKVLQEIPKKPIPPKFNSELLQGWGYRDANDQSVIRVLKAVGMLSSSNEPTELYSQFMNIQNGAGALAAPLRELYEPLFSASHEPWKESQEVLQNLFNIHSGGSATSLEQQIKTFKALAENTSFSDSVAVATLNSNADQFAGSAAHTTPVLNTHAPAVNINLHIHLPENKSRRDYEAMIEDIGRYIFGRSDGSTSSND